MESQCFTNDYCCFSVPPASDSCESGADSLRGVWRARGSSQTLPLLVLSSECFCWSPRAGAMGFSSQDGSVPSGHHPDSHKAAHTVSLGAQGQGGHERGFLSGGPLDGLQWEKNGVEWVMKLLTHHELEKPTGHAMAPHNTGKENVGWRRSHPPTQGPWRKVLFFLPKIHQEAES